MRHLTLLMVPVLASACGVELRAAVPEPVVTVAVAAPPPEAPAPPAAEATADVAPVAVGEPEEMTATSEPPDPVYEEQTDSPDPSYVWVSGYWGWNGVDWGWNWGRWAPAPDGQVYIAPYYETVGGSVVFVGGYWGPHDAPMRSYGGDRIRFAAAVRPANYQRGEHVAVAHTAGPAPGKRPGGTYEHATGTARAVPHQTAPQKRVATTNKTTTPRGGKEASSAHEAAGHEATTGRGTAAEHETANKQVAPAGHEAPREAPKTAAQAAPASHAAPSNTKAASAQAPKKKK